MLALLARVMAALGAGILAGAAAYAVTNQPFLPSRTLGAYRVSATSTSRLPSEAVTASTVNVHDQVASKGRAEVLMSRTQGRGP